MAQLQLQWNLKTKQTRRALACSKFLGESTLSVHIGENISSNNGITLYFECEELDEKVAELRALGLSFDEEPTDREWFWREAYLSDPNNNKICLFYAGENRKNPPWRVK